MNWHLYVAGAERVKWFLGLTRFLLCLLRIIFVNTDVVVLIGCRIFAAAKIAHLVGFASKMGTLVKVVRSDVGHPPSTRGSDASGECPS